MTDNPHPHGAHAQVHDDADFSLGKAAQAGASMDAAYLTNDDGSGSARAVFNIQLRGADWNVTLDGALLGKYKRMDHAMNAVETAARTLRAAGRGIAIVTRSSSGAVLVSSMLEAG